MPQDIDTYIGETGAGRSDSVSHLVSMHISNIAYVCTVVYNCHILNDKGIFLGQSGWINSDVPVKFHDITLGIWFVIYGWLFFMAVYCTVGICRRGIDGPLYQSPNLIPPSLFTLFTFTNCLNICWLFVVVHLRHESAGPIILGFMSLMLYLCIAISMLRVMKESNALLQRPKEIWWIVVLIQNGLAMYAGWTTLLTSTTTAAILQHNIGLSRAQSRVAVLYLMIAEVIAWFLCDMVIINTSSRYLLLPYFIACWTTGGIAIQEWSEADSSETAADLNLSFVLMVISVVLFFWKLVLLIYQHSNHRSYVADIDNPRPTPLERILDRV